jgi:Ca2+-binding EF-hand superfamily protein
MEKPQMTPKEIEKNQQEYATQAVQSFKNFQTTGNHISLDELENWVKSLSQNPSNKLPASHQ